MTESSSAAAVDAPPPATRAKRKGRREISRPGAIEALIDTCSAAGVQIRSSFVQGRDYYYRRPEPGPLAALVGRGRKSTFDQYMLLLACANDGRSSLQIDAYLWTRALGLPLCDSSRRIVNRNWRILSELDLIRTQRAGRALHVTLLREDGSGEAYELPTQRQERSLVLDRCYWRKNYHEHLTVPGITVLLIALTLGDWFALPTRRGPHWYGISRSTLERGFKSAYEAAVIGTTYSLKEAPLAPMGYTKENHYILLPPFGPRGMVAKSAPPRFTSKWPRPKRARSKRSAKGRRRRRGTGQPQPDTDARSSHSQTPYEPGSELTSAAASAYEDS